MHKQLTDPASLTRSHRFWRLVEIIPGALTWGAFLFVILGSIFIPIATANIIITYTLIWVFRTFIFSYNLVKSFYFSKKASKTDWNLLNSFIENPKKLEYLVKKKAFSFDPMILRLKKGPVEPVLLKKINELKAINQYLKPSEITHCITLPTYKESYEVIRASVLSYTKSNYDLKNVILMLAFEETDLENALEISKKIKSEFGHLFKAYLHSCHPKNLPGEHKGRAANATWAAKVLKRYIENNNISYNRLLLSSFDADTAISENYLSELTFRFSISKNRREVGFQPVPFYHNNIWDVPMFNRLVAISCSFWQMSVSLRKEENKSFSSRAMSFQSVMDFDYWDSQVVQDDSRQFWTAYFVYKGRHYLENIYSPVYMDAVLGNSYLETLKNQYKQLRRWAWGVSDLPFIVFNIFKVKELSLKRKIYEILHFIESVFFWATGPIILLFAGITPNLVNKDFGYSILSHNLPYIISNLLNVAAIGILVCLVITTLIIPFHKQKKLSKKIALFVQWIFVPIVSVFLSALPAIDAQTRLMLNKRLDFQVTDKKRKSTSSSFSHTVSKVPQ
jgi:hypothetical protein